MFQLNNLKPARGARRKNKRVGRGPGSGHGKTATRGTKGQRSRSGGGGHGWFEGGQMPLYRRIPKRGFTSPNRIENTVINLDDFERFDSSRAIDLAYLREIGVVSGPAPRVKILGNGEISGPFKVQVHAVSQSARAKIEAKGGSVEIVEHGTAGRECCSRRSQRASI
jgi:large subunit ribosomal protein L15